MRRRGARPEAARRPGPAVAPGARRRCAGAQLPPGRAAPTGHCARTAGAAEPEADLLRRHRLRRQRPDEGQGRLRPGAADPDRHVCAARQARRPAGDPVRFGRRLLRGGAGGVGRGRGAVRA